MTFLRAALVLMLSVGSAALLSADDMKIERLATCQDSWYEMKDAPARSLSFAQNFNAAFTQKGTTAVFVPKSKVIVAGLPVLEAYPESTGMGVGFSLTVDAPFDKARAGVEKALGKSLKDCETSDGMRTCGLEIGEKKTVMVLADARGKSGKTLVGCYYFYAK